MLSVELEAEKRKYDNYYFNNLQDSLVFTYLAKSNDTTKRINSIPIPQSSPRIPISENIYQSGNATNTMLNTTCEMVCNHNSKLSEIIIGLKKQIVGDSLPSGYDKSKEKNCSR